MIKTITKEALISFIEENYLEGEPEYDNALKTAALRDTWSALNILHEDWFNADDKLFFVLENDLLPTDEAYHEIACRFCENEPSLGELLVGIAEAKRAWAKKEINDKELDEKLNRYLGQKKEYLFLIAGSCSFKSKDAARETARVIAASAADRVKKQVESALALALENKETVYLTDYVRAAAVTAAETAAANIARERNVKILTEYLESLY